MYKLVALFIVSLLQAGCVSTHMEQFIGKDVREVVMSDGAPANIFDLGDGRRVFQFYWGGGTVVVPGQIQGQSQSTVIGDTVYTTGTALVMPPRIIESQGCLTNYITDWNQELNGWIVVEIRYPQRLIC